MNVQPIRYNAEMIRAILDGRKTQTRRFKEYPAGTVLWARETFVAIGGIKSPDARVIYRATGDPEGLWLEGSPAWSPSTNMPKRFARIWQRVTAVRKERLQDIGEADAIAEGVSGGCLNCGECQPCKCGNPTPDYVDNFIYLWNSIYGDDLDRCWIDNPEVYVHDLETLSTTGRPEGI